MTHLDRITVILACLLIMASAGMVTIALDETTAALRDLAAEEAARTRALDRIADECRP